MVISISFDTEPDLHTGEYKSVKEGIPEIIKILDKYNIKATFFITCDCLQKYPKIFQDLKKQGHELSLHAYEHKRFDELSYNEKEEQIKKSIACFKKYLNISPIGFRAPQFSIDAETLDLLNKYGFNYDSSIASIDLSQLFFHKKIKPWAKQFFSPRQKYKIRGDLFEIPPSSILIPFTSLSIRLFPKFLVMLHLNFLKLFYKDIIFYAHSWDFITLDKSKVMKLGPRDKFLKRFESFLGSTIKKNKFSLMKEL